MQRHVVCGSQIFLISVSIHGMHVSTNFGEEIREKKSPGTNGLRTGNHVLYLGRKLVGKLRYKEELRKAIELLRTYLYYVLRYC